MASMSGADAVALRHLSANMLAAGDRLDAIRDNVTVLLRRSTWEGGDAEHFRGQWQYRLSGLLHTAVLATREASKTLQHNAYQQEEASRAGGSAAAGPPRWTVGGPAPMPLHIGNLAATLFAAGGQLMLIPDLLRVAGKFDDGVKALLDSPLASRLLSDLPHTRQLPGPLGAIGLVIDGRELLHQLATNPGSPEAYKAGINTFFGAAEVVTGCFPPLWPLSAAIGGAQLLYNVGEALYPGIGKAAVEGVAHAATDAAGFMVDVVQAEVHMVQDAAEAVTNVVSGGVNAVRNFFHW